jgi:hypothetical protein
VNRRSCSTRSGSWPAPASPLPSLAPCAPGPCPLCSYIRYSYLGVAMNELQGLELTCTSAELA